MKKLLVVLCALAFLLSACGSKDYALQWNPGAYIYGTEQQVTEISEVTDADTVVVMYVDAYCRHCQRLLYEMAAAYPTLQERGIEVVALETGSASDSDIRTLKRMLSIPFIIVANVVPFFEPGLRPYTLVESNGHVFEEVAGADSARIVEAALNGR